MAFDLGEYKEVTARIADFKAKHPDGCLRAADLEHPYRIETFPDGKSFVVYVAAAYRAPDDPAPGIGVAWEPYPGKSNYTRDSELQNAETSAWGRAIVAVLASESKSIASQEDVRNRRADQDAPPPPSLDPAVVSLRAELAEAPAETRAAFKAKYGLSRDLDPALVPEVLAWLHEPVEGVPA